MKRFSVFVSLLFVAAVALAQSSVEDYRFFTIPQADDYEGKVVSTFIAHKSNKERNKAVLYLHGYNDYFFQYQMGDSVIAHGMDFYAVELRKYGRSKLENQTWFELKDLSEYYAI